MLIEIITDGGGFRKDKDDLTKYDAVSAYIIFVDKKKLYETAEVIIDRSNIFAEINAICIAMEMVVKYLEEKKIKDNEICLVTDSLLCINTLTKWIYSWIKKAKDGVLYSSTGKPVANQETVLKAFASLKVLKKYGNVNFYHINSHIAKKDIKTLYKKFKKFNKIDIDFDNFVFLYNMNKYIDEKIQLKYAEYIKNNTTDNKDIKSNKEVNTNATNQGRKSEKTINNE